MSANFPRTIRDLQYDTHQRAFSAFAAAAVLATLWFGWLFLAHVAVYRTSDRARLILGKRYEADAVAAGRIQAIRVSIGQQVHAGQILVELDSESERRQLIEDHMRLAAIRPQIQRIDAAIDAEQRSSSSNQQSMKVSLAQATVRWRGATESWRIAADIARRYEKARQAVSEIALLEAVQQAQNARAEADALYLELERISKSAAKEESDRRADIERLRQNLMQLIGEQQTTSAEIQRLLYQIEKCHVRAPIGGRVAGLSILGVGRFVREGDLIGTIVPPEKLEAVADFTPATALGVIRPGQPAWLHLSGFPWMQYGSISATVANVASEPTMPTVDSVDNVLPAAKAGQIDLEQKLIRVELRVHPGSAPLIPLQYGLPGTAEIEVDKVTPATLIMRTIGAILTKPSSSHAY
jgi:multidrug resistance efflux pump